LLADEIELECAKVLLGVATPGARWKMFGVRG
jgi:hypothetical protein